VVRSAEQAAWRSSRQRARRRRHPATRLPRRWAGSFAACYLYACSADDPRAALAAAVVGVAAVEAATFRLRKEHRGGDWRVAVPATAATTLT